MARLHLSICEARGRTLARRRKRSFARSARDLGGPTAADDRAGRHGVADRIHGLDVGADDYLGKPFAFEELLARLRAITRRGRSRQLAGVLSLGPLELDPQSRQVTVDNTTSPPTFWVGNNHGAALIKLEVTE